MSGGIVSDARRRAARVHAGRSEECGFCGRRVFGNGGKVAHARSHVRRGEAVELVRFFDLVTGTGRIFLRTDDAERIERFIASGYSIAGVASTEPGEQR